MPKRNGFTLVEIMVVVVIMGVLAAVGVPKLFGVIAKAKAAEVPVAAGTYISLQNTYLHENNAVGSWQNIGYGAPDGGKSDNFEYIGCIQGKIALKAGGERMVGWQAFNLSSLNSCTPRSSWSIIINPLGEHELNYEHIVSSAECGALTLNWTVGAAGEGACAATTAITPESSAEEEPESSDDNEENSSASEPGSSASSQSSEANQDDKPAACNDIEKVNNSDACSGTAQGWVYVVECGFFAPKGNAKNKGLTIVEKKKDSDFSKYCNSSSSQGSSATSSAASSSSNSPTSATSNGSTAASGTDHSTSGGTGGTNSGDGTSQGTSAGGSSAQPTSAVTPDEESSSSAGSSSSEESSSSAVPVIKDQNGNTLNYESIPATVCKKTNGNCNNKDYIPKEQCAVYNTSTKRCTTVASSSSSN